MDGESLLSIGSSVHYNTVTVAATSTKLLSLCLLILQSVADLNLTCWLLSYLTHRGAARKGIDFFFLYSFIQLSLLFDDDYDDDDVRANLEINICGRRSSSCDHRTTQVSAGERKGKKVVLATT